MALLWEILQFILRLGFGMSLIMTFTSSRLVTSGFFRVHLWVLMGLNVFASLVIWTAGAEHVPQQRTNLLIVVITNAVLNYVAACVWLYEKNSMGKFLLLLITILTLGSAYQSTLFPSNATLQHSIIVICDISSAGALLGTVMMSMLLGHWYLNTPGMKLQPLHQLLWLCLAALCLRSAVSAAGTLAYLNTSDVETAWWIFLSLRWITGLAATTVMVILAKLTLRVPNTQSATGILYAATVVVLIGELTAQLLTEDILYPL